MSLVNPVSSLQTRLVTQISSDETVQAFGRESFKPSEFVENLLSKAKSGTNVFKELHQQITAYPATFDDFLNNPNLNRFPNVLCLDRSRVKLSTNYGSGDYCHASYVDSYERKDGYVFSQAPFSDETEELFWRMVIDVNPKMILVLGTMKMGNDQMTRCFWPKTTEKIYSNNIKVIPASTDKRLEHDVVELQLASGSQELLRVLLVHYKAWEDDVPIPDIGGFRQNVKDIATKFSSKCGAGPTVLVCANGATRCGTYAAVDVILSRMNSEKKVGAKATIEIILAQRYGCFQLFEHYRAIHNIAYKYCISLYVSI